jgi:hypothetical protein
VMAGPKPAPSFVSAFMERIRDYSGKCCVCRKGNAPEDSNP